jgi:hypothetical protein
MSHPLANTDDAIRQNNKAKFLENPMTVNRAKLRLEDIAIKVLECLELYDMENDLATEEDYYNDIDLIVKAIAAEVDAAVRAENERCVKVVEDLTICLGGTTYEIRKQFVDAIRLSKLEKETP